MSSVDYSICDSIVLLLLPSSNSASKATRNTAIAVPPHNHRASYIFPNLNPEQLLRAESGRLRAGGFILEFLPNVQKDTLAVKRS